MSLAIINHEEALVPRSQAERFFTELYGGHMKQFPKRSGPRKRTGKHDVDRQWVFVGNKERMKSVATLATLYAVLVDSTVDTTYYTPNGYYRRDQRLTETLRWLNAFVFDLDQYGETPQEVFDRIDRAGLPCPTAVVRTPSGGFHIAYFFTQPVRATERAVRLYSAIMGHMAMDLGADLAAVGANRIFRTPNEQNLIHFDPVIRYDFDVFKNWREVNHPYDPDNAGYVNIQTGDLMSHSALQYLLTAYCPEGKREQTALTLALAMKASDWPQARAEVALQDWFIACCDKGAKAGKKPFTQREAVYKVGYVYRKSNLHAPKAEQIRELTGLPFYYQTRNHWESAKPRSERDRVHLHEWRADILALLEVEKEISGTQQELAKRLNCPLTSFKAALGQLKAAGSVIVEVRKGRCGMTVLRFPEPPQESEPEEDNVLPFPELTSDEKTGQIRQPTTVIIHADFEERKIQRIEHRAAASAVDQGAPSEPDPEGPD
ncbi:hypothetical protein [Paenibacillus tyrfis]|uniref:hypothetical protein n=1 Tax=Paenibacillus tyrfis TaxID=1501230 RepID=UPI0020A1AE7A|nr:hypothetical protein [Paenibacillus tyrfis]MCP1312103.1 hypothetical protein [Paenibacillus tyrfis]